MPPTLILANKNYSSWSLRPWFLLRVLGIPFSERVETLGVTPGGAGTKHGSPTGLLPVLIDGETLVHDSLGITLYVAARHNEVWPDEEAARVFSWCSVAEMHSGFQHLRRECSMNVGLRVRLRAPTDGLARDVRRVATIFTEGRARFGGPWLAGPRPTAVDAFFAPVVFRARTYGLELGAGQAYVEWMLEQPAMLEWERAALDEPWREPGHEAEVREVGEVLADHRRV